MAIFLPQRWRSQPQGMVGVDWGNPLTRNLRLAVSDNIEAVRQRRVPFDSRVSRGVGAGGRGWQRLTPVAANPELTWATGLPLLLGQPYTISVVAQATPNSWSGNNFIASLGFGYAFLIHSSGYLNLQNRDPNNNVANAQWFVSLNYFRSPRVLTGGWDGSAVRVWADGTLVASASLASLAATGGGLQLYGEFGFYTQHFLGTISGAFAWTRSLTTAEVRSHGRNPWQVFSPIKQVIYSFPTGIIKRPYSFGSIIDL